MITRLAHKIWEKFEEAGIQNDAEGNYRCAENIMKRIMEGTYGLDEFRNFFNAEDYKSVKETIQRKIDEDTASSRLEEDSNSN